MKIRRKAREEEIEVKIEKVGVGKRCLCIPRFLLLFSQRCSGKSGHCFTPFNLSYKSFVSFRNFSHISRVHLRAFMGTKYLSSLTIPK